MMGHLATLDDVQRAFHGEPLSLAPKADVSTEVVATESASEFPPPLTETGRHYVQKAACVAAGNVDDACTRFTEERTRCVPPTAPSTEGRNRRKL